MSSFLPAAVCLATCGCASTSIEFPVAGGQVAKYTSTRDSDIGGLRVEITSNADGTSTTVIELEAASGHGSPVNAVMWQAIAEALAQSLEAAVPP